jgi:DNA-binding transcriptional LysR family regulator
MLGSLHYREEWRVIDARLSHVVAVARHGSFTAAAQVVGVTQPAITKSVAGLERQLGFTLFHRTARGVVVTERGRDFIERAARLLDDGRDLMKAGDPSSDPFAAVLRVGVSPPSLEWLLIEPIAALQAQHPQLRFEVSSAAFERVVQQLRNGMVDAIIGFEDAFREAPDLQLTPAGALETALFVRNGHPILERCPPTLDDLAQYVLISPSESRPYGLVVRDLFESRGADWRARVHRVDYFPLVRRIVARSDAVGVVARSFAGSADFRSNFTTIDALRLFEPASLCCVVDGHRPPSQPNRAFVAAACQTLRRLPIGVDALHHLRA